MINFNQWGQVSLYFGIVESTADDSPYILQHDEFDESEITMSPGCRVFHNLWEARRCVVRCRQQKRQEAKRSFCSSGARYRYVVIAT